MDLRDKKDLTILAIESSCDETAAAVVRNGREILSNVVASQIDIHKRFGGVVPEIASRNHTLALPNVVEKALSDSGLDFGGIDAIAVTYGAGLLGALLTGVSYAKGLSFALKKPLFAVSHVRGHIAANYIAHGDLEFPYICALASGGHTAVLKVSDYDDIRPLGSTKDDAAGEAFDKAARVLGLPYPGGPEIQRLAENGRTIINFTKPLSFGGYDFSFSGLKTAVINYIANNKIKTDKTEDVIERIGVENDGAKADRIEGIGVESGGAKADKTVGNGIENDGVKADRAEGIDVENGGAKADRAEGIGVESGGVKADRVSCRADSKNGTENGMRFKNGITRADIAASFQLAAVGQIKDAAVRAAVDLGVKRIALSGGVGANRKLREELAAACADLGIGTYFLPLGLCTDNAAMIAAEAYFMIRKGKPCAGLELDAKATVGI
ncbi:MAG: tRNA (adenosine(37)-N6)-threonylcarbamoyltransferase complex transferase subunit TsaD [Clostridiales bacterium]|nr:tRNA (adenosine(37)-N6)-threonylcarbamoyltransferase complex transferase subunit TsaD [Clostridiales bacterium]